jgi:hypothetical protein
VCVCVFVAVQQNGGLRQLESLFVSIMYRYVRLIPKYAGFKR